MPTATGDLVNQSKSMPQHKRHSNPRPGNQAGFTLLELSVVVFLIGLMAAVVIPQLIPIIAFSELEGSARRLAGYGRGAMAHATLLRERIVVRVDLKTQEIYAVHWIYPETEAEEALADEPDQLAKLAMLKDKGIRSGADLDKKLLQGGELGSLLGGSGDDGAFDPELAGYQMDDKFNAFTRQALEARAANVKHDESFLDGVGDIFSEVEKFDLDEEAPEEEELADPILRRTRLRGDVRITEIEIDGERVVRGVAEIEFTVLGLAQKVVFFIENDAGEAYTILWDPVTAKSDIARGRESDL